MFSDLQVDEAHASPDHRVAYIAGHFGRPGEAAFTGFVLTVDADLRVLHKPKFADVVQDLAADPGVPSPSSPTEQSSTLRPARRSARRDYPDAVDALSVRRDRAGGLWIGVNTETAHYVLTPTGRVDVPEGGSPDVLVAVPGAMAVLCDDVARTFFIDSRTLAMRAAAVPRSAAHGVLVGDTLWVLSAGADTLTAVRLPSLATTTYDLPEGSKGLA